jgi:hypothetical protein
MHARSGVSLATHADACAADGEGRASGQGSPAREGGGRRCRRGGRRWVEAVRPRVQGRLGSSFSYPCSSSWRRPPRTYSRSGDVDVQLRRTWAAYSRRLRIDSRGRRWGWNRERERATGTTEATSTSPVLHGDRGSGDLAGVQQQGGALGACCGCSRVGKERCERVESGKG